MMFKDIKSIFCKNMLRYYENCIFDVIILFSLFFKLIAQLFKLIAKILNNTTANKNLPCNDFCGCSPTCENTDLDPILQNNYFPEDDSEKVNDDL